MLKKLAKLVMAHPKKILAFIIAITVLSLMFFPRLRIDSEIRTMLPMNSEAVRAIEDVNEKFGGADYIIALVENEDIFNPSTLQKIDDISVKFKGLPDISEVLSITKMDEIKGVEMGIEVNPIVDRVPQTKKEIESFKKYLLSDKRYKGIFVSPDSRYTIIIARLAPKASEAEVATEAEKIVAEIKGPEKIYLIGPPYITKIIQDYLITDLRILLPITALIIIVILYLSFRSFSGVFLPLLTVGLSTMWTLGLIAFLNEPLTMITTILPVILFSVGTAYALHIIARYEEEIALGVDKKDAIVKSISNTGIPVFLAAITTAFGFVSNFFTALRPIKIFGLASAFGVILSFLFALTLVPILLLWFPKPKFKTDSKTGNGHQFFAGFLRILSQGVAKQKAFILILAIVLVAIFAIAIPRIETESNFIQYFKEGSGVRTAHNIVDEKFGGALTFDVVVKGDILDPAVLKQIEKFEEEIKKIEHVNYPNSIADVLKDANKALNEGNPAYEKIPPTREASAQYMLLLTMGGSSFLNNLITPDYREAHITARVSSARTKILKKIIKETEETAKRCFGPEVEVMITGSPFIIYEVQKLLISNQYSSLIFSFISVLLIITLIYRTATSGTFTLTPIFVTVISILGIMGWFNIPLDMANTMSGSIAIGIGIDYSCHFFARYKEERKKGATRSKGAEIAINSVGTPILFNAIAVGVGFLVLIFSTFKMLGTFGILIAMAMGFSSMGALIIFPILILIKGKVKGDM
ncbi:hypothetical protein AUJ66_06930 [Candidatus Desantisbacteria bacterium CG1_02_38_46]|uniref:SSD domain-containing protein n=2 Tax=unclassified Candidatus Desantisiibacteriota TaxID=3106372 RepID=A0A2H9PCN6_9BACT|nr:MAG: hypothetical protein AUJ66_06930 [Candidatus Desantisbacteria bacterium CG1_02_38_46]PIZ15892.1 MAG: hypothetical protein COY51_04015 [Candidatus Desantisbacteria bacterium CG_4_10_14_0_8_um_filter_39_17]